MFTVVSYRTLYYLGMKFFSEYDLCSLMNVDVRVVSSWLKLMENHYHSQNTYHNSTHAADVLQATVYFLKSLQDKLVLQGVRNIFLVFRVYSMGEREFCWENDG